MSDNDNGGEHSRGHSLDRFQQSKKRLDPPLWIRHQTPLPPLSIHREASRPRYSEHRRSYSAHRNTTATSASTSFWRHGSSREPSPGPGSRPATAAGRFQSSSFSRWSASTLCSDGGQFSNGDNTPTDSVYSAFSMRSSIVNAEPPCYRPPQYRAPSSQQRRPYMGWRSQDSLVATEETRFLTPAERLAHSYKKDVRQPSSKNNGRVVPAFPQQHQLVHDSIKSISTAIMEFCQAEDVPSLPTGPCIRSSATAAAVGGGRRNRIVWLESSFVTSTPPTAVGNNNSAESTKSKI